jgi:hypothetical protein
MGHTHIVCKIRVRILQSKHGELRHQSKQVYAYWSEHEVNEIKGGLLERIDIVSETCGMNELVQILIDPFCPDANQPLFFFVV